MKHLKSILFSLCLFVALSANAQLAVQNLICNNAINPLAIDKSPRFSWQLKSEKNNVSQKAYQILVASTEDKLKKNIGDIWDSGKVNSNQSINVIYKGQKLT